VILQLYHLHTRLQKLSFQELIKEIAKTGSIAHIPYLPRTLRRLFRTAHDIDPEWHVLHQAAWQAWIDAAVSKTVNLRHEEPPETVWRIYLLAWRLGCKGITIYRDKSKSRQVIEFGLKTAKEKAEKRLTLPKKSGDRLPAPPSRAFRDAEAPLALRPQPEKKEKLGLTAMRLELEKKLEEAIRNTRLTADKVRIGKEEYIAVAEEYAGGCPTCDI
jgi:ribonucleotide reductase alpha subunit